VTRWTDQVRREILPNGLTVLVQRDDSAPVASVITHVKAGFFDEPDHWQGISHVLEHMFFKGTSRRGPGDIARETKAAGGYLNAGTGYDHTSYYVVLPASGLAEAIDIQSDALRNSVIEGDELARELQVIIQEAKRKLDSPSAVANETLHELMYDRHRIRRWRIGHEETLAGFTRDDVLGYYRSRYVPERTIVSIVGAVNEDYVFDLVRESYGDWAPRQAQLDPAPEEPPHTGVRARTLRGDVTHTQVALGWQAVGPLHPDAPALDLAAAVLGTGRGAWLYRALREMGLATSVSAHYYAPTELGVFGVSGECEANRTEEVLRGVAAELAHLASSGPSDEDLERARTLLLTRWARRLEPMDGRGSALAEAEALKHVTYLDEEYAALAAVTRSAVREVVNRYIRTDSVSGLVYHPAETGPMLDAGSLTAAFHPNGTSRNFAPSLPAFTAGVKLGEVKGSKTAGVHHVALPGADLLVRRKTGVPTVTLGLYVPRSALEDPARAGIGSLALRTAVRGAGEFDARGLAFAFERLGGSLGVSPTADRLGMTTTVLSERLTDAAQLLRLVLEEPNLAEGDVLRERHLMIEEALQVADDMFRYPFLLAFRSAFSDSGYGLPVAGLPETLEAIAPEDVRDFFRHGLNSRAVIVAVGDIDPEQALAQLAGVFGDISSRAAPERRQVQSWASRPGPPRVIQREKAQTAFAMAFPGPRRNEADRHAAEVWAAVASGLGGRLFESLRSRRSLAYTVMASSWQRGGAGALLTYIATAPEREEEARAEMLVELEQFRHELVTPIELAQAVSYLAGQAEVARQNSSAVAGEIVEAWLAGDGLSEIEDPGRRYRQVKAEAVQEVAAKYLDPEQRVEGVVRGKSK
jgi:zinc protease